MVQGEYRWADTFEKVTYLPGLQDNQIMVRGRTALASTWTRMEGSVTMTIYALIGSA